jgi:hypothetical protein
MDEEVSSTQGGGTSPGVDLFPERRAAQFVESSSH